MRKIICCSFATGTGGIDLGFELTKNYSVLFKNDMDEEANKIYKANIRRPRLDKGDISLIQPDDVPDADVFLLKMPFHQYDIDEKLWDGFVDLIIGKRMQSYYKAPRVIFIESTRDVVKSAGLPKICDDLTDLGYKFTYKILNAREYGNVPYNKEYFYLIAFRDAVDFELFQWPEPVPLTRTLKDVIDFKHPVEDEYYVTEERFKNQAVYKTISRAMEIEDSNNPAVYLWNRNYCRVHVPGFVPAMSNSFGQGGHTVDMIKTEDGRIRELTQHECFNVHGFPIDFELPDDIKRKKLYQLAGNSSCVSTVRNIANSLFNVLNDD